MIPTSFQNAPNSLTATFLRGRILRAIRKSPTWKHHHAAIDWHDVAFAHPTILALAKFILDFISGQLHSNESGSFHPHDATINNITTLIGRYTQGFKPRPNPLVSSSPNQTVLLTGSTGSLGTHLLSQLLADENVEKVWALNRKSTDGRTSRERQIQSLEDKCLGGDLDKVAFIDVNMAEDELGLDRYLYQEVCIVFKLHTIMSPPDTLRPRSLNPRQLSFIMHGNLTSTSHYCLSSHISSRHAMSSTWPS